MAKLKKLIGLLVLVTLGLVNASGQKRQHDFQVIQVTELQPLTLDLAVVIDLLADYNIKHLDSRDFGWVGLTVPMNKTIYIYDNMSQADKKTTLLHELYHAAYYKKNVQTGDPYSDMLIEQKAEEAYQQLYGFAPAKVNPEQVPTVADD